MEPQLDRLVQKTWAKTQTLNPSSRLLIAIAGIPGSGKTHLARSLVTRLNTLFHSHIEVAQKGVPDIAVVVPMDGFHYPRSYLAAMPDPKEAFARRGAHWTFDAAAFLELVKKIRAPVTVETPTLFAPSFDHAVKDPVENDIPIPRTSRVVVFEGLYLALDTSPWREAGQLMDEIWFVDVDEETAGRRLVGRHVKSGIVRDEQEGWTRVRGNDLVNGREIVANRVGIHEVVKSIEDEGWRDQERLETEEELKKED